MVKLLAAFVLGWLACIVVAGWRNRVNRTPIEVYRKDGTRIR